MLETPRDELKAVCNELEEATPAPFNSMLEQQPREDAMKKHRERAQLANTIVAPTCTGIIKAGLFISNVDMHLECDLRLAKNHEKSCKA